jgi:hypothetical protein
MTNETPPDSALHRTSLLRRGPDPSPARGELVWNEEGSRANAAAQIARDAVPATVAASDPEPLPHAVSGEAPTEVIDATTGALASELARRRAAGFERLDAEMRSRRAELAQSLERQRAEGEQRVAEAERLEHLAIAQRRGETDRLWSGEQREKLSERLDSALTAELVETRRRYEAAEMRLRSEFEDRRRDEAERLEEWRRSERERLERELGAEEQRFSDRLMRQLKEFEFQLGERQREQEQRLAQWWDETEQLARKRVAALLDETLSKKALTRT